MSKYLFFISIFWLLVACAGRQPTTLDGASFVAEGKFAVRQDQRSQSANFRWRQDVEGFEVEIWGLLGQGRTHLAGSGGALVVSRGGEVLAAGPANEVMQAHLGFSLPVVVMASWLHGRPAGRASARSTDDQGRLVGFAERGWQVELANFRALEPGSERIQPARIVAQREGQKVTVAIRRFLQ